MFTNTFDLFYALLFKASIILNIKVVPSETFEVGDEKANLAF